MSGLIRGGTNDIISPMAVLKQKIDALCLYLHGVDHQVKHLSTMYRA